MGSPALSEGGEILRPDINGRATSCSGVDGITKGWCRVISGVSDRGRCLVQALNHMLDADHDRLRILRIQAIQALINH